MHRYFVTFLACSLLGAPAGFANPAALKVSKQRFQRYPGKNFERLVFEFTKTGHAEPTVKTQIDGHSKETVVQVKGAKFQGVFPESINESLLLKSTYLPHINFAAEGDAGFSLKMSPKDSAKVDAFWLENPSRLVVDAFAPDSPRAHGLDHLFDAGGEHVAGHGHGEGHEKPSRKLAANSTKGFTCYPATAAVGMKVNFRPQKKSKDSENSFQLEGGPRATVTSFGGDAIVCFPKKSEVTASISFETPLTEEPIPLPLPKVTEQHSPAHHIQNTSPHPAPVAQPTPQPVVHHAPPPPAPLPIPAPAPVAPAAPTLSLGTPPPAPATPAAPPPGLGLSLGGPPPAPAALPPPAPMGLGGLSLGTPPPVAAAAPAAPSVPVPAAPPAPMAFQMPPLNAKPGAPPAAGNAAPPATATQSHAPAGFFQLPPLVPAPSTEGAKPSLSLPMNLGPGLGGGAAPAPQAQAQAPGGLLPPLPK